MYWTKRITHVRLKDERLDRLLCRVFYEKNYILNKDLRGRDWETYFIKTPSFSPLFIKYMGCMMVQRLVQMIATLASTSNHMEREGTHPDN